MSSPKQPQSPPMNLSDPSVQEWVLRQDKETRLEGLCVEYVFRRLLIEPHFSDADISMDWWFIAKGKSFLPVKLLYQPILNSTDRQLFDVFIRHRIEPWFIFYQKSKHKFYTASGQNAFKNGTLDASAFRVLDNRKKRPAQTVNDVERQSQAILFLKNRGLDQQAAVQRYVANWLLGGHKLWDLDCFVLYKSKLIAFEVKQKYPTKAGTFGLNIGLMRLFDWLKKMNICVYHLILTKPVWKEKYPALEFIENKKFWQHSLWMATQPGQIDEVTSRVGIAPAKTSIHGTSKLSFFHLPIEAFSVLGKFDDAHKALPGLLEGHKAEPANLRQIPHLSTRVAEEL